MFATKALIYTLLLQPLMAAAPPASKDILQKFITSVSKSYKLDTAHAPFTKVRNRTVHCSGNTGTFAKVWQWQTLKVIGCVKVVTKSHIDATYINRESETNTFKSVKSVAVAYGTTRRWTIGGKASTAVGEPIVGDVEVEISVEHKDESTETTMKTVTTEHDAQCPRQT